MSLISRFESFSTSMKQETKSRSSIVKCCVAVRSGGICACVCRGSGADLRETADTCMCVTTRVTTDRQTLIIKTRCVMHTPQIHITGHLTFNYLFKYLETGLSPPPPCCCSIQMFGSHNRESLSSLAMAFEALKS